MEFNFPDCNRAQKSAIRLSGTSRHSFWASTFYLSDAQWQRDQADHLSTNSLKSKVRRAQGKYYLIATCPKGKPEFNVFFSPVATSITCGDMGSLHRIFRKKNCKLNLFESGNWLNKSSLGLKSWLSLMYCQSLSGEMFNVQINFLKNLC